jgi:alpha-glucosidase
VPAPVRRIVDGRGRRAPSFTYGEEAEAISKAYISFRYALMPYLYSVFHEASETGMPVNRSLAIDHSFDARVYEPEFQNQFLFGPGLLVSPMTSREQVKSTYLPAGQWYDLFTDERHEGGRVVRAEYADHRIPIFARASAIIPMQGKVQSTRDDPGPVLTVHVFNGSERNEFVYYDKQQLERLRAMEPMKPQATLEFDDAPDVVVRWR